MDYKLIKENFDRATAKLMQEKRYTSMYGGGMGSLASILVTKAFGISTDDRLPFKVVAEKESEELRNLPGAYRSPDVYVDITTHVDLSAKQKETFLKNFDRFVNRIIKEAARMSEEGGFQGDVRAVGNAPGNKVSITLGYIDPRRSLLPNTPPKKETELKRKELGVTQDPSPMKEAVESAEFTEEEKEALGVLKFAINVFRGGEGFASQKLMPLDRSTNAKVIEINERSIELVDQLAELENEIGMLLDGEPEEADYDTETDEFINEEMKKFPGLIKGNTISYIGQEIAKRNKTAADFTIVKARHPLGGEIFYAFPKEGEFPEQFREKVINPSAEDLNRRSMGLPPSTYHKD